MSQDNAGHQIGDISVMYKSMKGATLNGFDASFHFKQITSRTKLLNCVLVPVWINCPLKFYRGWPEGKTAEWGDR